MQQNLFGHFLKGEASGYPSQSMDGLMLASWKEQIEHFLRDVFLENQA